MQDLSVLLIPADKYLNEKEENVIEEYVGKEIVAGIRPEAIHDDQMYLDKFADSIIEADVEVTELMGAEIYLYLLAGEDQSLIARVASNSQARAGDKIKVALDTSKLHLFDKDTERYIAH